MDLKVIHDTVLFFLNKEQNAYISHEEIDMVLDKSQLVLFNQYNFNPKAPNNPALARYGDAQRINDSLAKFKSTFTFTTQNSTSSILDLPADFMHLIAMYTTIYSNTLNRNVYNPVQVLNEEELILRLESQVIPLSIDDPVAIMNSGNSIMMYPDAIQTGAIIYFRRPAVPSFKYTQSGRNITYNQNTSVQLEWSDSDIMNIITIALSYYGLNVNSADLVQFGQVKEAQGQ